MKPQRVVITGLGVISALGHNCSDFWKSLSSGDTGISAIEQVDCTEMRFTMGAEVKNYNGLDYFNAKQIGWLDRFTQFALIAAKEAVQNAQLTEDDLANTQTAVITGSCLGGKNTE